VRASPRAARLAPPDDPPDRFARWAWPRRRAPASRDGRVVDLERPMGLVSSIQRPRGVPARTSPRHGPGGRQRRRGGIPSGSGRRPGVLRARPASDCRGTSPSTYVMDTPRAQPRRLPP
jgi:hypothetical protein